MANSLPKTGETNDALATGTGWATLLGAIGATLLGRRRRKEERDGE
ncbi:LPXTG cell wall anchor domain-containing protein [Lactococcus protaetiae]